jgi:hypothetical protein
MRKIIRRMISIIDELPHKGVGAECIGDGQREVFRDTDWDYMRTLLPRKSLSIAALNSDYAWMPSVI